MKHLLVVCKNLNQLYCGKYTSFLVKIFSTESSLESAYIRRFNKHSEEGSVNQDKKVKGVVNLAIGKELFVASSFAEDNSEASLQYFPSV